MAATPHRVHAEMKPLTPLLVSLDNREIPLGIETLSLLRPPFTERKGRKITAVCLTKQTG